MPSDVAVRVRGLGKVYRIPTVQATQGDGGDQTWHRKRLRLGRVKREEFAALSDINLDIPEGQVVGVIGRNGAGKSTLLKILSRITNPSSGRIDLYGRVGCLLEVGTGFHPELTGRENVYLSGAILGMKRREIDARFDSIVDFAETSAFLDTPVKRYSSGMYVRLAFAVAAHLEPEILIVDEVLAVGDTAFQKKCLTRMQDASSREGRTVLFVSHNMTAIESICSRGVLLEGGVITFDGTSREAVDAYLSSGVSDLSASAGEYDLVDVERGSDVTKRVFQRVTIRDGKGEITGAIRMGDAMSIAIDLERGILRHQGIDVRIVTDSDRPVVNLHSHMKRLEVHDEGAHWDQVVITIPEVPLVPGTYWISLMVREGAKLAGRKVTLDRVDRAAGFEVNPADVFGSGFQVGTGPDHGVVFIDQHWEARAGGEPVATSVAPRSEPARRFEGGTAPAPTPISVGSVAVAGNGSHPAPEPTPAAEPTPVVVPAAVVEPVTAVVEPVAVVEPEAPFVRWAPVAFPDPDPDPDLGTGPGRADAETGMPGTVATPGPVGKPAKSAKPGKAGKSGKEGKSPKAGKSGKAGKQGKRTE